ncbi:hypothetical protein BC832DRAFT_596293 [Gaertneriomyces semiglobifer]|nr:hypothetical protein BC832DRAFT_596293 [Gaertneriomyces semiglobifer]
MQHKTQVSLAKILLSDVWDTESTNDNPVLDEINLRAHSQDLNVLPSDLAERYGESLDTRFHELFPETARKYLIDQFDTLEEKPVQEWENIVNDWKAPKDAFLQKCSEWSSKLYQCSNCRAFANPQNPLKNCQTLECDHLSTFIHPIFRESCHHFANQTSWQSGEIGNLFFLQRTKADGVAILRDRDSLPLAYFEGSRPKPSKKKNSEDSRKVIQNLASMQYHIHHLYLSTRRRVPSSVMTFGAQSIELRIICSIMEYQSGCLMMHEFDSANIPCQENDRHMFTDLYECVISWTILMDQSINILREVRSQKRASRKSHIMATRLLARGAQAGTVGPLNRNSVEPETEDIEDGPLDDEGQDTDQDLTLLDEEESQSEGGTEWDT